MISDFCIGDELLIWLQNWTKLEKYGNFTLVMLYSLLVFAVWVYTTTS